MLIIYDYLEVSIEIQFREIICYKIIIHNYEFSTLIYDILFLKNHPIAGKNGLTIQNRKNTIFKKVIVIRHIPVEMKLIITINKTSPF